MATAPREDGLRVVDTDVPDSAAGSGQNDEAPRGDGFADLETLRDEFVAGFNARDIDAITGVVGVDVETPDVVGDGVEVLADEIHAIWERSPGAILTRAFLDDSPCAVAWLPDEDGCWSRAALVCFDAEAGVLSLVSVPDDADALDRADAEDPGGEELDEWSDWSEWDSGEETNPGGRR